MKNQLPNNWVELNLESVTEILDNLRKPINASEREARKGNIPYYGATGLAGWIDDYLFNEELVLLGEDGAPFFDKLKDVAYLINGKSWVNNHAHVIKAKNNITTNKFLLYFLNQFDYKDFVAGTTRLKLTQGDMKNIPITLPPLPEQQRIVAKLNTLFGQFDKIKILLERIPQLLKDFRQSVLSQAVTGKLNGVKIDGDSWEYVQIDKLVYSIKKDIRTGPFGSSLKKSDHKLNGVPVWGIESINKNGEFTGKNKIYIAIDKANELKSFEVIGGDIIISRSGTVGELCLLPNDISFGIISTNLMKISLNKKVINPTFFIYQFKGSQKLLDKLKELCSGSTRLFLTQTILKKLDFVLPSLEQQQEIVIYVESLFAKADKIETQYQTLKEKIEQLPQAILAKAFRGELVEQLPSDGDARDLLEEIKKAKSTSGGKGKKLLAEDEMYFQRS